MSHKIFTSNLETYVWLQRQPGQSYSAISGAHGPTYDPGFISTTMEYRRCARRSGCSAFVGESIWITMTVNSNCINPPTSPDCAEGNFLWENNIDVTNLSGSYGIPQADVRLKSNGSTYYSIPGPYPNAFNGSVVVSIDEAISWDGYLSRASTGDQPNEQWRVVFKKNGNIVASSSYTGDLNTGVMADEWVGSLGSDIYLPQGADEIIIAHYENSQYGTGSAPSANSVVPVSICISYEGGCDNVTDGGVIGNAQSSCVAFDPEAITNTLLPNGGTGNLEYQWYSKVANQSPVLISGATSSTYDPGMISVSTDYLRVSKRDGCEEYVGESNWISMTIENNLTVEISSSDPICSNGTGMIEAMAYGATGMASFDWNNGSTMSNLSGLGSGTYYVTVTDEGGCTTTGSAVISIPEPLVSSVVTTDLTALASDDGTAQVTAQVGIPGYTYAWSNGDTSMLITDLAPNTYYVTVTDANGCTTESFGDVYGPIFSKGGSTSNNEISDITISAYPNPLTSADNIYVRAQGLSDESSAKASVYDLQGQLIITENVVFQNSNDPVQIGTSGILASGTYILRIETSEKTQNLNIQVLR